MAEGRRAASPAERPLGGIGTSYGTMQRVQQHRVEINDELLHGRGGGGPILRTDYFGRKVRYVKGARLGFLCFVCTETAFITGYCAWRAYSDLPLTDVTRPDCVYTMVVLLNALFACYFAVHGVLKERAVELYAFLIASLLLTAYVIYEYNVYGLMLGERPPNPNAWQVKLPLVRLVLDCVCEPINIIGSLYIARRFGWVNFLTVGADAEIGNLFNRLCVVEALLKINLQMQLSHFCVSFLSQASAFHREYLIEISVLAVTLGNFALGVYLFSRERRRLFPLWLLLALAQPVYIVWKMAEVLVLYPGSYQAYVKAPSIVLGCLNLLTSMLTIAWGFKVFRGFGKGLYEKIYGDQQDGF